MHPYCKRTLKIIGATFLFWGIFHIGMTLAFQPSHDRVWELGQETLPQIHFKEDGLVTIDGFRNFDWQANASTSSNYESRTFALDNLDAVDVFISHFDDFEGLAHIFLSFRVKDDKPIVISLETRREIGEEFSPLLGVLRQFEIIYVVGSEEDVVGLRTDVRDERVYLYPTKASKKQAQALFLALAEDINSVYENPIIYNTLTKNCTNGITRRVEDTTETDFPFSWKTILPGYFDEVLYDMNIIDTSAEFADIKSFHLINNEIVDRHQPTYSADLRQSLKQMTK